LLKGRYTDGSRKLFNGDLKAKTEWEIGMILGVSERTAEKFLSACRKVHAGNRTFPVTAVIRFGPIARPIQGTVAYFFDTSTSCVLFSLMAAY
jgi:hypothetical protein